MLHCIDLRKNLIIFYLEKDGNFQIRHQVLILERQQKIKIISPNSLS